MLTFDLDPRLHQDESALLMSKSDVIYFVQKLLRTCTDTHTHRTDCSMWTTKVIGKGYCRNASNDLN